jgi:hypothetical protein
LLEVLRETDGDAASEFRLLVQKHDGAWDVSLSIAPHDELNTSAELVPPSTTLGTTWRHCGPQHYKTAGYLRSIVAGAETAGLAVVWKTETNNLQQPTRGKYNLS